MNRIVLFGLSTFFGLVGIGLIGEPRSANAFHGWYPYGGHACHGWFGCHSPQRCYGCNGCWGCHACHGCCGGSGCHGCYGCYGCYGCQGCHGCYGNQVTVPIEATPALPPIPSPAAVPVQPLTETSSTVESSPPSVAEMRVHLPADASLVIDDFVTRSSGVVRHYRSPSLEAGKTYMYEVRAEVVRDGRTVHQTKIVQVRAGETANVDFELDAPQIAHATLR